MQTIGALLGSEVHYNPVESKEFPLNSNIGIELELEGAPAWPNVTGWRAIQDGSLRNGIEYVFDGPQGGERALKTILAMEKNFKKNAPAPTFRCSTHIHLDVRDLTLEQLQRLVIAYCIFEDVMFDHCDDYRRYSNFCTPYFVNDSFAGKVQKCLFRKGDSEGSRLRRTREFPKYSALNLQPASEFGSVEFRGSHAMTSGADLIALANRMMHLKRLAMTVAGTITEYIAVLNKMRPIEAFPTGLRDGYVRDFHTADTCYSNALLVVSEPRPAPAEAWMNAGDMVDVPIQRQPVQHGDAEFINIDPEVFQEYGILPPPRTTLGDVVKILKAFQNIHGIRRPTLAMLAPDVMRFVNVQQMSESFRRANLRFDLSTTGDLNF